MKAGTLLISDRVGAAADRAIIGSADHPATARTWAGRRTSGKIFRDQAIGAWIVSDLVVASDRQRVGEGEILTEGDHLDVGRGHPAVHFRDDAVAPSVGRVLAHHIGHQRSYISPTQGFAMHLRQLELSAYACTHAPGYLLGRPTPADLIVDLLVARSTTTADEQSDHVSQHMIIAA